MCVQLKQARCAAFQAAVQEAPADERFSTLRVVWKPDIERLWRSVEGKFSLYLNRPHLGPDEVTKKVCRALDLVTRKKTVGRVLQLTDGQLDTTKTLLESLDFESPFKRCKEFSLGRISDDQKLSTAKVRTMSSIEVDSRALIDHKKEEPFDIVIAISPNELHLVRDLELIERVLTPDGVLLSLYSTSSTQHLQDRGFSILTTDCGSSQLLLARSSKASQLKTKSNIKECVLISGAVFPLGIKDSII